MFCKKCGKQISDGVQFCPNCGASQESSAKEENAVTVQPAQNASGSQESKATGYASTALKAAVFGLLCWCCCGVQLIGRCAGDLLRLPGDSQQRAGT